METKCLDSVMVSNVLEDGPMKALQYAAAAYFVTKALQEGSFDEVEMIVCLALGCMLEGRKIAELIKAGRMDTVVAKGKGQ